MIFASLNVYGNKCFDTIALLTIMLTRVQSACESESTTGWTAEQKQFRYGDSFGQPFSISDAYFYQCLNLSSAARNLFPKFKVKFYNSGSWQETVTVFWSGVLWAGWSVPGISENLVCFFTLACSVFCLRASGSRCCEAHSWCCRIQAIHSDILKCC